MQLFYSNKIEPTRIIIEEDECRHLKVLRKNVTDIINVVDGKGGLYEAQITNIDKNTATTQVLNKKDIPFVDNNFHLLIAPTKQSERMEWMLEKCIEMGLQKISFIETEKGEKTKINLQRMHKIAISAMKQSNQYHLCQINGIIKWENAIKEEGAKFIAHCAEGNKIGIAEIKQKNKGGKCLIFIGPEGDFSPKEIAQAQALQITEIGLGNNRLRTETAGLLATSMMLYS